MAKSISIIIPVYNVAADLPRCLDSVLAQTYPDIEIIAVNDGSTDCSGEILDQYAAEHANVHVIHKENGGVTSARLRGVAEATGDWIGFVDGDDEIEPHMYTRLLKNAMDSNAQISHCGYQMIFPDGRVNYFYNSGCIEVHDRITALRELLSGTRIEPGLWNKLFHASLFDSLSMPADIRINEDLLMNFYLFSAAEQTVFEDCCPYHYIVREGSTSRAKLNEHKIYDPIKVKKIILSKCGKENLVDAQRAFMSTCVYTYCGLITERNAEKHRDAVRGDIVSHKEWSKLLPKRTKLLAELAIHVPMVLSALYPVYSKLFQERKYD